MISTEPRFGFVAYIAADLRRQHELIHGTGGPPSSATPWMGVASPRFMPVLLCRLAHRLFLWRLGPLAKLVSLLNFMLFGIEISIRCPIGPGLFFPHTHGTVVGAWKIGRNATIFQGVTLGARELDFSYVESSRPTVGDDVTIGAGAKVLGGIQLGNRVRIGANSVVLDAMPDGAVAVGVPARVARVQSANDA